MKNIERPDWTAMKITVIVLLIINAIITAAIIAGLPYIICKIFNLA